MTRPGDEDLVDRLSRTLVELADTLVQGFDVVDFLQSLSTRCVELLCVASAGVMLHDRLQNLQVIASSDERARALELLELSNQEGPCLDAFRLQRPVQATGAEALERWPEFTRSAERLGLQTYVAVPLRLRSRVIGVVSLFRDQALLLDEQALRNAQALADVATIGLLNARALEESQLVAEQLQHALTSRVVLEQAKGALSFLLECSVDEAFLFLRRYARNHNLRLGEVARAVLEGRLSQDALERG